MPPDNHNKIRSTQSSDPSLSNSLLACPNCQHTFTVPTSHQPTPAPPAVLFTTWGALTTEASVKASPYYTSTLLPRTADHNALIFHAAHPVPHRYLHVLAPEHLESLKTQLTTDVNYGHEMRDRVSYTVDAIDEVVGGDEYVGEQMRRSLHNWTMR